MLLTKQISKTSLKSITKRLMFFFIRTLSASLSYVIEDSLISLKSHKGVYKYTSIWLEDDTKIGVSLFENTHERNLMRLCIVKGNSPMIRISIPHVSILRNLYHFQSIEQLFLLLFPKFKREEFYSWECDCDVTQLIQIIQKHKG